MQILRDAELNVPLPLHMKRAVLDLLESGHRVCPKTQSQRLHRPQRAKLPVCQTRWGSQSSMAVYAVWYSRIDSAHNALIEQHASPGPCGQDWARRAGCDSQQAAEPALTDQRHPLLHAGDALLSCLLSWEHALSCNVCATKYTVHTPQFETAPDLSGIHFPALTAMIN